MLIGFAMGLTIHFNIFDILIVSDKDGIRIHWLNFNTTLCSALRVSFTH